MDSPRHIVFDLDGTLVDSLPGITRSVEEALALCGLPPLRVDIRPLIGPPIRSILATVSGVSDPPALDRLEQAFRLSYDTEGWRKTVCYEGVRERLWGLLTGEASLYLVTNKPHKATRRILRELKLDGFFLDIVCPDSRVPPYGSKTEALTGLLRRRRLSPGECLLVGDTQDDANAAAAAGIRCAIVEHGYGGADLQPAMVPFDSLFAEGAQREYAPGN